MCKVASGDLSEAKGILERIIYKGFKSIGNRSKADTNKDSGECLETCRRMNTTRGYLPNLPEDAVIRLGRNLDLTILREVL